VTTNTINTVVNTAGTAGYSGDGGVAASAQINLPSGIWVDSHNDYFVSDSGNELIRVVNNRPPQWPSVEPRFNPGIFRPSPAAAMPPEHRDPPGPAPSWRCLGMRPEDAEGNLYIVDQGNNRVLKVTNPPYSSTAIISVFAGNGRTGYTATAERLQRPR